MPTPTAHEPAERLIVVNRKQITLKHLDKVIYPKTGMTKAAVIDYYARIAEYMLPHLRGRAVTLRRYPHGVDGDSFFEKACPSYRPAWLRTAARFSTSRGRNTEYCVVNSIAALVWLANIAALELHVPLALASSMSRPRTMVFDLDPGPGSDVITCADVALLLRERLDAEGLSSVIKTSGSKGLQMYVPLNLQSMTFTRTKDYARRLASDLANAHPDLVVAKMSKSLRADRVFIDWSQNDDNKTTVCVYSLRGRDDPTISTPVAWKEVEKAFAAGDPRALSFTSDEVLKRVAKHGDLFADLLHKRQRLPRIASPPAKRAR